jgi:hypothetical protein
MRRTQLLDNNPNSIYGASRKLANIATHNLKNPIQNDGIQTSLDSILKPTPLSSTISSNKLSLNTSSSTLPTSSNVFMTKSNTDVDEFLTMITDTNTVLQSLDILLENFQQAENDDDNGTILSDHFVLGAQIMLMIIEK